MNLCAAHSMPHCRECNRTVKAPFGSTRSELKKKRGTRHIRPGEYAALIGAAKSAQGGRCAGHIADPSHECDPADPLDACHIVPQRTLVRELGEGTPALTDPRNVIYACRTLHGKFDNDEMALPYPADFDLFLIEYQIEHNGRYWICVAGGGGC